MENIKRVQYNTLTFIHLYLAATKVNREFASEKRMGVSQKRINSALAFSLPLNSLATPQVNSQKTNFSTI